MIVGEIVGLRRRERNENVDDKAVPRLGRGEHEGIVRHAVERGLERGFVGKRGRLAGKRRIVLGFHLIFGEICKRLLLVLIGKFADELIFVRAAQFELIIGKRFDVRDVVARGNEVVGTQIREEGAVRSLTRGRRGAFHRLVAAAVGGCVAARINLIRFVVIRVALRIDARRRGARGLGRAFLVLCGDDALFLRVDGVVEHDAGAVLREFDLVLIEEVRNGCERLVLLRLRRIDRSVQLLHRIRPAVGVAVGKQIYHGMLHVDSAVHERIGDERERIVIRQPLLLHDGVPRRNKVRHHFQLGDLRGADRIFISGILAAFGKIFALRNIHFRNDLLVIAFEVGRNQIASCEHCSSERGCKRDRRNFCCFPHDLLRQKHLDRITDMQSHYLNHYILF